MADETLNIKVKIDTSAATASTASLKSSFGSASSAADQITKATAKIQTNLTSIKRLNLASAFSGLPTILNGVNNALGKAATGIAKGMTGGIKAAATEAKLFAFYLSEIRQDPNGLTIKDYFKDLKDELKSSNAITNVFKRALNGLGNMFAKLKGLVLGLGKAIAKMLPAAAILAVVKAISAASTADTIKDEAQKVHLSTTAYQEWGYVLNQNGIEIASLKTGMRQFSSAVASGDEKLKKYGITATDVSTAFEQAIFNLQNLGSETEKVAALTDLFGTRASELYPILNMSNDETKSLMETYRAIGGTMSNELIAKGDVLTDSILEMKSAFKGLGNTIAGLIMPVITQVVQGLTLAIAKITLFVKSVLGIKETFGGAQDSSAGMADSLESSVSSAKKLRTLISGFDELNVLNSDNGSGDAETSLDLSDVDAAASSIMNSDLLAKLEEFKKNISTIEFGIDIDKLTESFNGLLESVKNFAKTITDVLLPPLKKFYDTALRPIVEWIGKKLCDAIDLVSGELDLFSAWFEKNRPMIEEFIGSIANLVRSVWEVVEPILNAAWNCVKFVFGFVCEAIRGVLKVVIPIITSIINALTNMIDFLQGAFSLNWKKAWEAIKTSFKTTWDSIKSILKGVLNSIITLINSVINGINKIKLPDWAILGKAAGKSINIPKIPYLAKGGVLREPTLAVMGEYAGARSNPEIAAPQSLLEDIIVSNNGEMVSVMSQLTSQLIAAINNKDLEVSIGDDVIARSAQRGNNNYKMRTGKTMFA